MGRQKQLLWMGIAGFWGVGVPLGWALAFPAGLGLPGLWLGQLAGSLIVGKPSILKPQPLTLNPTPALVQS